MLPDSLICEKTMGQNGTFLSRCPAVAFNTYLAEAAYISRPSPASQPGIIQYLPPVTSSSPIVRAAFWGSCCTKSTFAGSISI